jgi:hypothetical protein
MYTVDLNFHLKDLSGKELEGDVYHIGKTVAIVLSGQEKSSAPVIKLIDWAQKLYNKEAILVDDSDKQVLTAIIETTERLTNLQKASVLRVLKDLEKK